jgi:hypothetical protein
MPHAIDAFSMPVVVVSCCPQIHSDASSSAACSNYNGGRNCVGVSGETTLLCVPKRCFVTLSFCAIPSVGTTDFLVATEPRARRSVQRWGAHHDAGRRRLLWRCRSALGREVPVLRRNRHPLLAVHAAAVSSRGYVSTTSSPVTPLASCALRVFFISGTTLRSSLGSTQTSFPQ